MDGNAIEKEVAPGSHVDVDTPAIWGARQLIMYSCCQLFVIAIINATIVGLTCNDVFLAGIRSLFLCALLATSDGSPTSFTNGIMQR